MCVREKSLHKKNCDIISPDAIFLHFSYLHLRYTCEYLSHFRRFVHEIFDRFYHGANIHSQKFIFFSRNIFFSKTLLRSTRNTHSNSTVCDHTLTRDESLRKEWRRSRLAHIKIFLLLLLSAFFWSFSYIRFKFSYSLGYFFGSLAHIFCRLFIIMFMLNS